MGSKNEPGKFDCYANAEPDEPMFVLLGRDRDAPARVEAWADAREKAGEDRVKVADARWCAQRMRVFRAQRQLKKRRRAAVPIAAKMGCAIEDAELALSTALDSEEGAYRIVELAKRANISVAQIAYCFLSPEGT